MTDQPETIETTAVAVPDEKSGIVRAAPGDVAEAFEDYRKIQETLDRAMPDCLMQIQGRAFRKKNYWRGVATAFNLSLECRKEERVEEGGEPRLAWGYSVVYRAIAPNGRHAEGDGTCMAYEKAVTRYQSDEIDWDKTANNATLHNVRSHAHTRAMNRAISNLVGFGEVSAEEMPYGGSPAPAPAGDEGSSRGHAQSSRGAETGAGTTPPSDAWLDEPLGFGKHKPRTWRYMMQAHPDYLEWLAGTEGKNESQKQGISRAKWICDKLAGIATSEDIPF